MLVVQEHHSMKARPLALSICLITYQNIQDKHQEWHFSHTTKHDIKK
jgi:hypothetical protein